MFDNQDSKLLTILVNLTALFLLNNASSYLWAANKVKIDKSKEFQQSFNQLVNLNNNYNFRLKKEIQNNNKLDYEYAQNYNGIEILNTSIVLTDNLGSNFTPNTTVNYYSYYKNINGIFYSGVEQDLKTTKPFISKFQAVQNAIAYCKVAGSFIISDISNMNINLYIKNYSDQARLVYLVDFHINKDQPRRPVAIIDANNGELLETWEGSTVQV